MFVVYVCVCVSMLIYARFSCIYLDLMPVHRRESRRAAVNDFIMSISRMFVAKMQFNYELNISIRSLLLVS